jgi:hypothetical protein
MLVRYMSTESYVHWTYETKKITSFSRKGYAEIHIQRLFFDIENGIWKILVLKSQKVCTCFGVPLHMVVFFLKKIKIPNFGGISKFLDLIVFRQNSGSFGLF